MGERGGCGCERVRRGWTWVWLEVGRLGLIFCAGGKVCGGKKGDGLRYPDTATKDQRRSILCSKDEYIFVPWKVRNYLLSYHYMSTRGRALRWTQPLHWGLFEEATPGRVRDSKMSYASIWERLQYSSRLQSWDHRQRCHCSWTRKAQSIWEPMAYECHSMPHDPNPKPRT